jgi:hypothetical protein
LLVGAALQSFRTLKARRKDPSQPFRPVFCAGMNAKSNQVSAIANGGVPEVLSLN